MGFIIVELQDLVFASCLTDVVLTKLQKAGRKGEQGNDRWNKSREVVMQKTGKSSCEKCKARIDRPPTLSNPVFELLRTRINIRGTNFSFCYQTRFEGYPLGTGLIVGVVFSFKEFAFP